MSWALVVGAPGLAVLVTMALLVPAVPSGPASPVMRAAQIAGVVNLALAAFGSAAGGLFTRGTVTRRVTLAAIAGAFGAAAYFVLLSVGVTIGSAVLW